MVLDRKKGPEETGFPLDRPWLKKREGRMQIASLLALMRNVVIGLEIVPGASVEPESERHWDEDGRYSVAPGVVVPRLHVELPALIAQPDREPSAGVDAAGAVLFGGDGFGYRG